MKKCVYDIPGERCLLLRLSARQKREFCYRCWAKCTKQDFVKRTIDILNNTTDLSHPSEIVIKDIERILNMTFTEFCIRFDEYLK